MRQKKVVNNLTDWLTAPLKAMNDSKVFAGLMIIILNVSSKYVNLRLPKAIEAYMKNTFSRNILVFAICWMGTRDIFVSLAFMCFFILLFDYVFNEESPMCCLPESFTNYYKEEAKKDEAKKEEAKKEGKESTQGSAPAV